MHILSVYDRFMGIVIRAVERLAIILMVLMSVVCMMNVVCRFILSIPMIWGDELMRYCSIWLVFTLSPALVVQKMHLMVDMTTLLMPKPLWKPMLVLGNVLCSLFMAVLLPQAIKLVMLSRAEVSVAMGLPMPLVYLCIPVGVFLMLLCFIRVLIGELFPESTTLSAYQRPCEGE